LWDDYSRGRITYIKLRIRQFLSIRLNEEFHTRHDKMQTGILTNSNRPTCSSKKTSTFMEVAQRIKIWTNFVKIFRYDFYEHEQACLSVIKILDIILMLWPKLPIYELIIFPGFDQDRARARALNKLINLHCR
jgi:hypothetical protein